MPGASVLQAGEGLCGRLGFDGVLRIKPEQQLLKQYGCLLFALKASAALGYTACQRTSRMHDEC